MNKKILFIALMLSIILWFASRYVQTLVAVFIIQGPSVSFFAPECSATGYPVAICVDASENSKYIYYLINIVFWFIILFGIWKLFRKFTAKA